MMYFLKFYLPIYFALASPCEDFLNKEILPMEFRGEVVKKYTKNSFWYIDIKDEISHQTISFTLKNYDYSNFFEKIAVKNYVVKRKGELDIYRGVIISQESAQRFTHQLSCK